MKVKYDKNCKERISNTQTFNIFIANDVDGDGDPDPDSSTDGDEDSDGNLLVNLSMENNLTECMEGRELTFTAEISKSININKDDYYWSYVYTSANGTEYSTSVGLVTDRTLTYGIPMENVLDGDTDHFYPAYSYVTLESYTANNIESNKRNFKVFELFIERIWYTDGSIEKDWKAVVGEDFSYEAIAANDANPLEKMTWNWEFLQGETKKWSIQSTETDGSFSWYGQAKIPYTDLNIDLYGEPQNSWFGNANGVIRVSCTDHDGNPYEQISTDPEIDKKITIFYDPKRDVNGDFVEWESKIPLWYYCMQDLIPELSNFIFDINLPTECGRYDPNTNSLYIGHRAFYEKNYAYYLSLNSYVSEINSDLQLGLIENYSLFLTSTNVLESLSKLIHHELYHQSVHLNWGSEVPFHSDKDKIPDEEEITPGTRAWPGSDYFIKTYYGFSDEINEYSDTYDLGTAITPDYREKGDNELRAWQLESHGMTTVFIDYSKDWSKRNDNSKW